MTLAYDQGSNTFKAPVAGDILESDFDIDDFIKNSAGENTHDRTIKSPKRNRPKF